MAATRAMSSSTECQRRELLTLFDPFLPSPAVSFDRVSKTLAAWRIGCGEMDQSPEAFPIPGSFQRHQLPLGRIASGSPQI
jgi:hypothetical protein